MAEKDRLINLMASNGTSTEPMVEGHVRARRWRTAEEREQEPLDEFTMRMLWVADFCFHVHIRLPIALELSDTVMEEIEERQQWLEEMTALGQGDKYRRQVQAEISMRVSRMEKLERERRGE